MSAPQGGVSNKTEKKLCKEPRLTACVSIVTCSVLFQSVPDVTVEIIISSEKETTALGKRHRRDSADNVVVRVHSDFLVSANVKEPARGVVRSSCKCKAIRKELQRQANNKTANIIINVQYE